MHEELGKPSSEENNSRFENMTVGVRMEKAIVAARLKIMAGFLLYALAPLGGMPIPPETKYGIFDYNFSYRDNLKEE